MCIRSIDARAVDTFKRFDPNAPPPFVNMESEPDDLTTKAVLEYVAENERMLQERSARSQPWVPQDGPVLPSEIELAYHAQREQI